MSSVGGGLLALVLWCLMANGNGVAMEDPALCSSSYNYSHALGKAIMFFEGQRSGKLPPSQRVNWRADSALADGKPKNVDLTGGYYDAGDNVKFGWTMAHTVTVLSWAAVDYRKEISSVQQLGYLQETIRWGTDFFLEAYLPSTTTLYTQVGDGNADHNCWERPEDMDTPRTLYKINKASPGTEAAADASAALAAASMVFRRVDTNYSAKLVNYSKSLFNFADTCRGNYQASCPFYCSYSGYTDELLWAAAWLNRATREKFYRKYLSTNQGWSQPVSEFSWDNKLAGVQTILAREFFRGKTELWKYKNGADSFVCAMMPGSSFVQIHTTPGGLLYTGENSNLQYATGASMILLAYSKTLRAANIDGVQCGSAKFSPSDITAFAKTQVDYILGNNPRKISYMVGFGNLFPMQVHHRGASMPSKGTYPQQILCGEGFQKWYNSPRPNQNNHTGAVVGGPDGHDQFTDIRSNFKQLEPTTYMTATFVGSLAPFVGPSTRGCSKLAQNQEVAAPNMMVTTRDI